MPIQPPKDIVGNSVKNGGQKPVVQPVQPQVQPTPATASHSTTGNPVTYNEQAQTNYGTGALGQVLSYKKYYDSAVANNNTGLKTWATSGAQGAYAGLDANTASLVKGMNTQQLIDYINNQNVASGADKGASGGGGGASTSFLDNASAARDAQIASGNAGVDATLSSQITSLQKAYEDAVMNGQLSTEEAKAAFESQKKVVEQQAYQDTQMTNLAAEDRGIGNSQQMVGLMQGDNARKNGLLNENMTVRDKAISDIQTRLRGLATQTQLDITGATAQAGYQKVGLAADANAQYNQNMFQFGSQDYFAQQQQGFNQQNLATQQGYTQQNMQQQQGYTQDNMALGQKYNMQTIAVNFKNTLQQMKVGQGYDMEKIGVQFANQLTAMGVQNGYDNAKLTRQINADKANLTTQIQAENDKYNLAIAREMAKYDPNTPEGKIRLLQLQEAKDNALTEIHTKTLYESQISMILEQAKEIGYKAPVAKPNMTAAETSKYNSQMEIYQRYQNVINGKNSGSNLMNSNGGQYAMNMPENPNPSSGNYSWTAGLTD